MLSKPVVIAVMQALRWMQMPRQAQDRYLALTAPSVEASTCAAN